MIRVPKLSLFHKMRALLVAALPALATAQHYPGDPISVASYGGNWTIAKSGTCDGKAISEPRFRPSLLRTTRHTRIHIYLF